MATTDMQRLVVALEARTKSFENALNKANGVANRRARAIESRFALMNKNLNASFAGVSKGMLGAFAGVAGIRAATGLIDASVRITNALKVAGLEGEALEGTYQRLMEAAKKNAAPLEALVTLYGRVALVQKELGVSGEQVEQFTGRIAMALRVAGVDAQSASGALLQLSQALGSGVVRAEEFNSILEGAPTILQAAANGIVEAEGSVAKLRTIMLDGKLASRALFDGIEAGAYVLEEKLASAQLTVSQSFENLRTSLIDAAKELNEGSDASEKMAEALQWLSEAIANTDFSPAISGVIEFTEHLAGAIGMIREYAKAAGDLTGASSFGPWIKGKLSDRQEQSGIQDRISGAFAADPKTGRLTADSKPTFIGTVRPEKVSIADYAVPAKAAGGGGRKGGGRSRGNDWEREVEQIKERTAALLAETAAMEGVNPLLNDYGMAMEVARTRHELLTAAEKAGLEITPALRENIDNLAASYASASVEAEKLAESQDRARETAEDMRNLGKDVLGGFINDLRAGKSGAEALSNALNKVADKLIEIGLNSIFDSKGGGGGLGGILSFIPKLFGFADGGVAAHGKPLKRFAKGGVSRSAAIFGEAGPEAAVPLPDGRSIPVTLSSPKIPAGRNTTETIRVVLQDDSGRMAQVADQRIKTASGPIIQVSVQQSLKATKARMPTLMANAQTRAL